MTQTGFQCSLELAGKRAYAIGMSLLSLLAALLLFGDVLAEPSYPPNAISGGTVVAALHAQSGGATQVDILSGEEPFASSSKTALQNWDLQSGAGAANLVVVYFRQPGIYYLGDAGEEVRCTAANAFLPCPKYIVGPAYPAQASAQGSVILRMEIADDGGIRDIQTLKGMGVFTEASVDAVRKWRFSPAEDEKGMKKASRAYAVFVYRFPVTTPKR